MSNGADIAVVAVLMLSALFGLWRGLAVEVLSLLIWLAAFWLAFRFGQPVSTLFEDRIEPPSARYFIAFGVLFIGALLVGAVLTWLVAKLVQATGLTGTDRMLGLLFGLARGVVLVSVVVLLLGFTPIPQDDWWQRSRLLPTFERYALWLGSRLPDSVREHLNFQAEPVPEVVTGRHPATQAGMT